MKFSNYSNVICALIIGISLIAGSLILQNDKALNQTDEFITDEGNGLNPLISVKEAAEYLGIPETEVWIIINSEEDNHELGIRFPIIKIEDTTYVSSSGLMEWLIDPVNKTKRYN